MTFGPLTSNMPGVLVASNSNCPDRRYGLRHRGAVARRCHAEKPVGKTRWPEIGAVDGNDRRAFGDAVAFDRADAEPVFEGLAETEGQFLRAREDHPQGAELFRCAAALIELEKRGSADQKCRGDVWRRGHRSPSHRGGTDERRWPPR